MTTVVLLTNTLWPLRRNMNCSCKKLLIRHFRNEKRSSPPSSAALMPGHTVQL